MNQRRVRFFSGSLLTLVMCAPVLAQQTDNDSSVGLGDSTRSPSNPVVIPKAPVPGAPVPDVPLAPEPAATVVPQHQSPIDRLKSAILGIQNKLQGKKAPANAPSVVIAGNTTYRLHNLKYRTGKHTTPDALVYVRKGFNPDRPVTLHIHNHGLMDNVSKEFTEAKIEPQLQELAPNTVFIMPEWAAEPSAYSSAAGPFHNPDFFKNMLTEIMSKTPPLKNKSLKDVSEIYVSTFSGGFRATNTEVHKNGLYDKVRGIVLLDSLYFTDTFDPWLRTNLKALASGEKFFYNFFWDTSAHSRALAKRVERMLDQSKLSRSCMFKDFNNGEQLMSPRQVARHGIVLKYSAVAAPERTMHQAVNSHYIAIAVKAINLRRDSQRLALQPTNTN